MRSLFIFSFFTICINLNSQASLNVTLIGNLNYQGKTLSDIWGYVDSSGNEYALVGAYDGTSIVDLSSPGTPTELFYISGAPTIWRDLKTHNHYAYVTNEGGNGLLIINLDSLPYAQQNYDWDGGSLGLSSAHNLYIDKGYAYIFGSNIGNGGCLILDLADPWNPIHVGTFDDYYIHDGYVRNDTLWASNILDGHFSVIDVSDKTNPIELTNVTTPMAFAHNCWLSDDSKYIFVTEEKASAPITSYEISDITNIQELDRYYSSQSNDVIPHNAHFLNGFIINSHYRDGLTIVDVSKPDNMVETGYYDTSPQMSGSGFNGSWGAYPYLPSQLILATDIENGLFVLETSYVEACYLEGNITDSSTTAPLSGATVTIVGTPQIKSSGIDGSYKTGYAIAGTYDIEFTKAGYYPKTISNITLKNDSLSNLSVELRPMTTVSFSGNIVDSSTQLGVENAIIEIRNDTFNHISYSNNDGTYSVANIFPGSYEVIVGKWGYKTKGDTIQISNSVFTQKYELSEGYYDDFALDFDWNITANASTGNWERGIPNGTYYQGAWLQADLDVENDISNYAYVTGNQGQDYYDDDIDDGRTYLSSPEMDLSQSISPILNFYYWFRNTGGQGGPPNDFISLGITNGIDSIEIFNTSNETTEWTLHSLSLNNAIALSGQMSVYFTTGDDNPGHLVEAGIDKFEVIDTSTYNNVFKNIKSDISVYPSVFTNFIYISSSKNKFLLQLYDELGRLIINKNINTKERIPIPSELTSGFYHLILYDNDGKKYRYKLLKKH